MAITVNIPSGGTVVFFRPYGVPGNATTDPSGSTTVTLGGSYSWFTESTSGPYKVTDKIMFTASKNTGTSSRNATVTIAPTTGADSRYDGTASVTCAYTITQAAAPEPPTPTIDRYVTFHATFSSTTSNLNTVNIHFYADGDDGGDSSDWNTNATYQTNSKDLNVGDSSAATIKVMVGVDVPPYNNFYSVEIQSGSYHQLNTGGGAYPASVQIGPIPFNGNQNIDVYVLLNSEN